MVTSSPPSLILKLLDYKQFCSEVTEGSFSWKGGLREGEKADLFDKLSKIPAVVDETKTRI